MKTLRFVVLILFAVAAFAAESLTNGVLTSGTSWTETGDGALAANVYSYTHSTGVGALSQANGTLAVALVPYQWYTLTYTLSNVTDGGLTGTVVSTACGLTDPLHCSLTMTAGAAKQFHFRAASTAASSAFTINFTSTAGGAFTLDTLGLQPYTFDDFDMPNAVVLPDPKVQFLGSAGQPLNGGKVYFYEAGTTTPQDTYTDSTGLTANANPVVLDSAGRANIWIKGESYKIVVQNSASVQQWTADNVTDTTFYYLEHLRAISDAALLGYTSTATGAVERSVRSRMDERLSVKDFGATGDGTTNDTAAIVLAVTAACASKQALYFPAGTYLTDAIVGCAGFHVYGEGKASVVKSRAGDDVFEFTTSAYNYVTIRDLKILGLGSSTGTGYGVYAHDLSGDPQAFRILNVHFESLGGGAVKFLDGVLYDSELRNITATILGDHGIYVYSTLTTATYDNIYVGQIDTANKAAFRIINGLFNCNHCNGVNTPTDYGMILGAEPSLDAGISGTVILNLTNSNLEAFGEVGIHFRIGSYGNFMGGVSFGCDFASVSALEYRYQPDTAIGIWSEGNRIVDNGGDCTWNNSIPVHASIAATATNPPFLNLSMSLSGAANYAYRNDTAAATEYLPTLATKKVLVGKDNYVFFYFPGRLTTDYLTLEDFQVYDPTATTGLTAVEFRNGAGQSTTPIWKHISAAGTTIAQIGSDASAVFDQFILSNSGTQRGRVWYDLPNTAVVLDNYNGKDWTDPLHFKATGGYLFDAVGTTGTPASYACFDKVGMLVSSATVCVAP